MRSNDGGQVERRLSSQKFINSAGIGPEYLATHHENEDEDRDIGNSEILITFSLEWRIRGEAQENSSC
jgi:hypothetical protein